MGMSVPKGETLVISPGDHFNLLLPDGTFLNVEQTQDDFSIVRGNGNVAYTKPTSAVAIAIDGTGAPGEENPELQQTTGRN
jgi:hypothetical protein